MFDLTSVISSGGVNLRLEWLLYWLTGAQRPGCWQWMLSLVPAYPSLLFDTTTTHWQRWRLSSFVVVKQGTKRIFFVLFFWFYATVATENGKKRLMFGLNRKSSSSKCCDTRAEVVPLHWECMFVCNSIIKALINAVTAEERWEWGSVSLLSQPGSHNTHPH